MKYENILKCKNNAEFRKWLCENHLKETECWIQCKRGKMVDENVFYYIDAVYTALSFGWIDSTYGKKMESDFKDSLHTEKTVIGLS